MATNDPDPAALFDVVPLPGDGGPAHFAIALPGAALRSMPGFPAAASPESGRVANGRGLDAEQCRKSCLGEAAELVSCTAWGDEPLVTASLAEMGPAGLSPRALNGFTQGQLRRRDDWNCSPHEFDWRPRPLDAGAAIAWLRVEDAFAGEARYVPADFAFIGRRQPGDEAAVAIGDSNGCAAGEDADAARLAAVLELVERDATARWWYGRRRRRTIDPAEIEGVVALTAWLAQRSRRAWLFDITTDLDVPVIAAVSAEPDGRDVALGFAAKLDVKAASVAALTEMLQMEISLLAASALGGAAPSWACWRAAVDMATPPLDAALGLPPQPLEASHPAARPVPSGQSAQLTAVLQACARADVDLWFADMTRPFIGVRVFRALSTKLCHYKPRFARPRLLAADGRDLAAVAQTAAAPWLLI
jgi:ribosomal protein S12 methylthiotransferase accessory factor